MRLNIRRTLVATALILGLSGTAQAATLYAGPLRPDGETVRLECTLVNVSNKTLTITIEVLDFIGVVNALSDFDLAPGVIAARTAKADDLFIQGYCRFTVPGSRANVRGTATLFEPGRGTIAAVPAH